MSEHIPTLVNVKSDVMNLEEVRELNAFLRGHSVPKGFQIRSRPHLGSNAAFSVIYILQEKYRLISDTFELCSGCHEIFDSSEGGDYNPRSGKYHCNGCIPGKSEKQR